MLLGETDNQSVSLCVSVCLSELCNWSFILVSTHERKQLQNVTIVLVVELRISNEKHSSIQEIMSFSEFHIIKNIMTLPCDGTKMLNHMCGARS